MRTVYHEKLSELADQLSTLCGLAGATMERATRALLQADLAPAEQVISDDDQIAAMGARAEESAIRCWRCSSRWPVNCAASSAGFRSSPSGSDGRTGRACGEDRPGTVSRPRAARGSRRLFH